MDRQLLQSCSPRVVNRNNKNRFSSLPSCLADHHACDSTKFDKNKGEQSMVSNNTTVVLSREVLKITICMLRRTTQGNKKCTQVKWCEQFSSLNSRLPTQQPPMHRKHHQYALHSKFTTATATTTTTTTTTTTFSLIYRQKCQERMTRLDARCHFTS